MICHKTSHATHRVKRRRQEERQGLRLGLRLGLLMGGGVHMNLRALQQLHLHLWADMALPLQVTKH